MSSLVMQEGKTEVIICIFMDNGLQDRSLLLK